MRRLFLVTFTIHSTFFFIFSSSTSFCVVLICRDIMVYGLSGTADHLQPMLRVLLEAVFQPQLTPEELDMGRQFVRFEQESRLMFPPPDPIMADLIMKAAFGPQSSYGHSKFCDPDKVGDIDRDHICLLYTSPSPRDRG